jgi:nucleoside-diphosphate-sugar epimerase
MKILITGACGFIGRNLIAELESDHELRLVDSVAPAAATVFAGGRDRQAAPLQTRWPAVTADISDLAALRQACEGMDAVIHLAADPTGYADRGKEIMQVNVVGTYVVLDAARQAGVRRVLCASSINAFGTFYWRLSGKPAPYTSMPLDESFETVPEDPYSLSKRCNEESCAAFTRAYGLTTAAFRFAGVFSAERYETFRRDLQPTAAWSDDLYQWVHVTDVVRGLRRAVESPSLPTFGVYTLAAGDTRCPEPTLDLLRRFRPDLAAQVTSPLPGRAPLLSIERAQQTFGYAPTFRLGA